MVLRLFVETVHPKSVLCVDILKAVRYLKNKVVRNVEGHIYANLLKKIKTFNFYNV